MEHAYTGRVHAASNRAASNLLAAYDDAVSELGLSRDHLSVRACEPSPGTVSDHESVEGARAVLERCTDLRLHPDARYANDVAAVSLGTRRDGDRYNVDIDAATRDAADVARDVVEDAFDAQDNVSLDLRRPGIATRAQEMVAGLYSRVQD